MMYPIAEIFHSIQGEGYWTGTPMMFVRLAGCNVGKYQSRASDTVILSAVNCGVSDDKLLVLESKHSICTSFDGQEFTCDTDYHTTEHLTEEQILAQLQGERHICITGGEPFLHDLSGLLEAFNSQLIHIETSGTMAPTETTGFRVEDCWITVCPKQVKSGLWPGIFEIASEWKFLVGPGFKIESALNLIGSIGEHTDLYLQPINGVHEVWKANLDHCLKLLRQHPEFKLSAQLHKYLEVR